MYILNDEKMLPEIFLDTNKLFEKVAQDLISFKDSLLLDNKEANVKAFFEKYSQFQTNGLQIFKTAMGDLCVGLKALGNKFGALKGSSFELLSLTSEKIIASTGEFISFITSFIVSTDQIMQENEQNVNSFETLCENVQKYFNDLIPLFKDLSDATMHLYGDAKNRLQDNFSNVESSLVNFIHMAKIKMVSALANASIGIKLGYDYFSNLIGLKLENIFDYNILSDNDLNIEQVKELLKKIIINFDEALLQAQKIYE